MSSQCLKEFRDVKVEWLSSRANPLRWVVSQNQPPNHRNCESYLRKYPQRGALPSNRINTSSVWKQSNPTTCLNLRDLPSCHPLPHLVCALSKLCNKPFHPQLHIHRLGPRNHAL